MEFEQVKKKLISYDNETNYQKKVDLADELMNMKYSQKYANLKSAAINRAKLLIHGQRKKVSSSEFDLTPGQRFLKRFLSPYTGNTGILLWHAVGTGKTCTSLAMAENFVDVMEGKVLIISSETLHVRFQEEIMGKGVGQGCIAPSINDRLSKTKQLGILSDSEYKTYVKEYISAKYEFSTLRKLINKYLKKEKEVPESSKAVMLRKYIKDEFSNRVLILDEVHSLRGDGETKGELLQFLYDIMRFATNVRLVLLSATPMYDGPDEIFELMNLLMLNDKSKPAGTLQSKKGPSFEVSDDSNEIMDKKQTKLLEYFASTYVSFSPGTLDDDRVPLKLSPFDGEQNVERKFEEEDHYDLELRVKDLSFIYRSYLSDTQVKALEAESSSQTINAEKICNICYDASVNSFDKFFKPSDSEDVLLKYVDDKKKLSGNVLNEMSPKIHAIIESVIKAKESPGVIFIYSRFKSFGVYPICAALEEAGFDRYDHKNMIHSPRKSASKYALLTGKMESDTGVQMDSPEDLVKVISKINAQEVKDDKEQLVKVIVGTGVVREGVDFKNIREIHILEPWWNNSQMEQVVGRGVRINSHAKLANSRHRNTTVFQHCVVHQKGYDKSKPTVDYTKYALSQQKEKQIHAVQEILRSNAIDCSLHASTLESDGKKSAKVRKKRVINSRNVEFDLEIHAGESLQCASMFADGDSPPSFDDMVWKYDVQEVVWKIQNYFKKKKVLYIDIATLKENMQHTSTLIDLAIDKIVSEKKSFIIDGFDQGRLEKSGEYIVFVDDKIDYPQLSKMQLKLYKLKKKKKVNTKIKLLLPMDKSDSVESIIQSVQSLKERLTDVVSNPIDEKIIYSMVLHNLNEESQNDLLGRYSEGAKDLNDEIILKDALLNDMIFSYEGGNYFVNLSTSKIYSKDDDNKKMSEILFVQDFKGLVFDSKQPFVARFKNHNSASSALFKKKYVEGVPDLYRWMPSTDTERKCMTMKKDELSAYIVDFSDDGAELLNGDVKGKLASFDKILLIEMLEYVSRKNGSYLHPLYNRFKEEI